VEVYPFHSRPPPACVRAGSFAVPVQLLRSKAALRPWSFSRRSLPKPPPARRTFLSVHVVLAEKPGSYKYTVSRLRQTRRI